MAANRYHLSPSGLATVQAAADAMGNRLALRRALRAPPPCVNDDLGPCWIDDEPATGSPNIDARNARYAQWED